MRLGWHIHLLGPFSLNGTVWRSKRRRKHRKTFHGELPGWTCPHNHTREDTARACERKEARRRGLAL